MNIKKIQLNGVTIAVVQPDNGEIVISDAQSALDLAMSASYETEARRIAIPKAAVADAFFILSTGLAGEILQKYINYQVKIAIFGDFSRYTSKPLRDFMYESNNGRDVFFAAAEEEAVDRLAKAR